MKKFKVDPKKVSTIVLKPPEMIGALRTGQIDGFIAWEPYPAKAQTMGVGQVLLTSNQIWKNHPCCVLIEDDGFRKLRPQDVEGMVKAHVEAANFIHEFPAETFVNRFIAPGVLENVIRK